MRYILDVSGRDLELIKASIVNFERSLEMSSQGDFTHLIDELNETYLSLKRQKTKQLNAKLRRKWKVMRWNVSIENLIEEKSIWSQSSTSLFVSDHSYQSSPIASLGFCFNTTDLFGHFSSNIWVLCSWESPTYSVTRVFFLTLNESTFWEKVGVDSSTKAVLFS